MTPEPKVPVAAPAINGFADILPEEDNEFVEVVDDPETFTAPTVIFDE